MKLLSIAAAVAVALIVDELHALLAGTHRQQEILLNALRLLASDLKLPNTSPRLSFAVSVCGTIPSRKGPNSCERSGCCVCPPFARFMRCRWKTTANIATPGTSPPLQRPVGDFAWCAPTVAARLPAEFPHKSSLIPELRILQAFEIALSRALNHRWSFHFPGAAAGTQFFLQTVEDLLWLLLIRPGEDFEHLFVHWQNQTLIRVPRQLYRNPRARPWLGDFRIKIRRGLVSHLAALVGGKTVRQQLSPCFLNRYGLGQALTILRPADAKEFRRRLASWPQMLKTLVFEPQSTH